MSDKPRVTETTPTFQIIDESGVPVGADSLSGMVGWTVFTLANGTTEEVESPVTFDQETGAVTVETAPVPPGATHMQTRVETPVGSFHSLVFKVWAEEGEGGGV